MRSSSARSSGLEWKNWIRLGPVSVVPADAVVVDVDEEGLFEIDWVGSRLGKMILAIEKSNKRETDGLLIDEAEAEDEVGSIG